MLIASIVLSLASLSPVMAPDDPPVYGPCAPPNPLTQYVPFDHNGLLWSCGKLEPDGKPSPGFSPTPAKQ